MTVKELKEKLAKYPDDMQVVTYNEMSEDPGFADEVKVISPDNHPYCQGCDFWELSDDFNGDLVCIM